MVNIKAVIYVRSASEALCFKSASEFIFWQINRYPGKTERDRFDKYYNITCKAEEKFIERKYGLQPGMASGLHLIFRSTIRLEKYLTQVELLEVIQDKDHIVVLELRPGKYSVATFYSNRRQFSIVNKPSDSITSADDLGSLNALSRSVRN